MIKDNTRSLKEVLDQFIDQSHLRKKLDEHRLVDQWESFVGHHIFEQTKQVFINNEKLYIKTESSVVRQELGFMKSRLISLINRKFGDNFIKEIVLL